MKTVSVSPCGDQDHQLSHGVMACHELSWRSTLYSAVVQSCTTPVYPLLIGKYAVKRVKARGLSGKK